MDPYGKLDPGADGQERPAPRLREVGTLRVLVRGTRKRCPRCGERRIFDGWFTLKPRCPTCDLRFEREESAIIFWLLVMVVGIALTVPVVPVAPLLAASIGVVTVVPVWFYPRSKTLWAAIEFLVARSEPGYRSPPLMRDPRTKDLE